MSAPPAEEQITRPLGWMSMMMVLLAVLAIFGGIVGYVTIKLREEIRSRILDRVASSLEQVITSEYRRAEEASLLENASLIEMDLIDLAVSSEEVIDEIALWSLELPDVQAIALYDLDGEIRRAIPKGFYHAYEDEKTIWGNGNPREVFLNESMADLVVSMTFAPEEDSEHTGYARFLLDGTSIVDEMSALDDNLRQQAGVAFFAGGLLITAILSFSFQRLHKASRLLSERGRKLAETNDRLVLASKSAALGSVTAHLMHGLKNPLAGLREYIDDRETNEPADEEVRLVSQAARSMQAMVEEALQVLQEQRAEGVTYGFTLEEMLSILRERLTPLADRKNVALLFPENLPDVTIDNLRANLIVLALFNLGQNAIEATPSEKEIHFKCELAPANRLCLRIRDGGPGLSENMLASPFAPRISQKKGGTGVGLAISQQLAERAEAELSLESSGTDGACFLLQASVKSTLENG
jgi:signal transduction histidine kinase